MAIGSRLELRSDIRQWNGLALVANCWPGNGNIRVEWEDERHAAVGYNVQMNLHKTQLQLVAWKARCGGSCYESRKPWMEIQENGRVEIKAQLQLGKRAVVRTTGMIFAVGWAGFFSMAHRFWLSMSIAGKLQRDGTG